MQLPQMGNKRESVGKERVDNQSFNRESVFLNQFRSRGNIHRRHGTISGSVEGLSEPKDEAQVGIDEEDRDVIFLSGFGRPYEPKTRSKVQFTGDGNPLAIRHPL